ncbi:uncharacterized protein L969DRAFT_94068 [Mixia osmundae IAM 14324]|uniref:Cyclin-dependent kinase 8 n=1 Tax=Mixia osmundae (strain CBS 9802 / IAM 14324 / JCM 22182 / KY 12970) TaxID=764103 RepID=G7E8Z9_MIXOS|nr:uncharacterized protein L969DRAFT_94068 [Mixia osmundae IAM 14324]KEI40253.1 hypothetical protein L969DRAFT_94068 [Mixia osmundae IAM 14324]GAA99617.1 hypothetical protein E5Q_06318 [Mixia osmundae IAM 14324]
MIDSGVVAASGSVGKRAPVRKTPLSRSADVMAMRAPSPMRAWRAKRDSKRRAVQSAYTILGFISSGTYGKVYKARKSAEPSQGQIVAIKKFKPDKEGEAITYTGISQSACREIMLNRELHHVNLAALHEVMLEDKSIYMIFEFAEHDFLQIIHYHSSTRSALGLATLKMLLWQLLNGVCYLHDNWVIHRDLKPANILVTHKGEVKIGDLGLARLYSAPLQPLYTSDKVVVTIWYRSPDLLLGARHYTPSIDLWSVGCIFGELIALRPMFKGEEAKVEGTATTGTAASKKPPGGVPFQRDQLVKIFEILGTPSERQWPAIKQMPDAPHLAKLQEYRNDLPRWYNSRAPRPCTQAGLDLIAALLAFDPASRLTARKALNHRWWTEDPPAKLSNFPPSTYPQRKVLKDDDPTTARPTKRSKVDH